MRSRISALLCAFALVCLSAHGQGFVSVSGAKLLDASGNPVAGATVCAQPVDTMGRPASIRVGGGGVTITSPVCTQATLGAWSMSLPDTSKSQPGNAGFAITATDNVSGASLIGPGYGYVQPTSDPSSVWCSAAGCKFDLLPPMTKPTVATVYQCPQGPQGVPGIGNVGLSDTTVAQYTSAILGGVPGMHRITAGQLQVGALGFASQDPVIIVARAVDSTVNNYGHAFADGSVITRDCPSCTGTAFGGFSHGMAYASYDTRAYVDGPSNFEHLVGYQAIPSTASTFTGVLNRLIGAVSYGSVNGGHVNSAYGYLALDFAAAAGRLDVQYGSFVDTLISGATNWAYYAKSNPSYFGGNIVGNGNSTDITAVNSVSATRVYAQGTFYDPGDGRTAIELSSSPTAGSLAAFIDAAHFGTGNVPLYLMYHTPADIFFGMPNYPNHNFTFFGNIISGNMTGSGNAFACVNASGQFYRSSTACQ